MTEKIFLTYTNATAVPYQGSVLGHHVVVNYVDSNGQLHTLQGLPENKFRHNLGKLGAFVREEGLSTGENNTDSPFGRLRAYEQGKLDFAGFGGPYTPIAESDDLSSQWDRMRKFGDQINSIGYEYRPYSQNSNSFAAGALRQAGLLGPGKAFPETFDYQIAVDPSSGQTASMSVPGFDHRLLNPIGESAPDDFDARFGNWPAQASGRSGNVVPSRVPSSSGASVFDTGAPAVPYVPRSAPLAPDRQSSFNDRFGIWPSASPAKAPQTGPSKVRVLSSPYLAPGENPLQPTGARQSGPVPLPIFGLPDRSAASGDDPDDWLSRWMPLLRR